MNKKKLYISLIALSIIFLGIGGTFAYLTTTATLINITQVKSGNLTMTVDGGGNTNTSFMPAKCTSEYAIKKKIVATSVNTSGGKVSFSIGLDITSISDGLKRNTMRYAITTSSNSCTTGLLAGGSFKDKTSGDEVWLIKNDYDNITKSGNNYTKTYYLYIWLDEGETQNLSGTLSVKMKGTTSNNPNLPIDYGYDDGSATNTLFYKIKSSADKITRIDFSKQSSEDNTNGIYTTTNTENNVPVYYYRGNVDNHVLFANFCWRIVRTTETGGVKLIYDGKPSNGQCNNTGADTTIGNSQFNLSFNSPAYVGYMYNTVYTASSKDITTLSGQVVFGNDAMYDASTNKYILKDTKMLTNPSNWTTEYSNYTDKYHYTCFTSGTSCQSVYYIYIIYSEDKNAYYFTLSNGKKPADILEEMLNGNDINTKDSTMKTTIDTWYKNNMTGYTSQLEDIAFCNDRTYYNFDTSGLNKDYSNYDKWLYFSSVSRLSSRNLSLVCSRQIDMFTVNASNGNGKLTYPVGLITAEEIGYAGGEIYKTSTAYYLYNGVFYWTLSPYSLYYWYADVFDLASSGRFSSHGVTGPWGARPVVSLKPGTVLASGSGTSTSPYIVG